MKQPYLYIFFILTIKGLIGTVNAQGVDLTPNPRAVFLQSDTLQCLGFEFSEGRMYLLADLVKSQTRNYLLVLDEKARVLGTLQLPGDYTGIYRSCNNKVFIGNNDSVCQVFYRGDTVALGYETSLAEFRATFTNCFFMEDGVAFKRAEVPNTMSSLLYAIYKDEHGNKMETRVFEAGDSVALKRFEFDSQEFNKKRPEKVRNRNNRNNKKNTDVDVQMARLKKENGLPPEATLDRKPVRPSDYHVPVKMLMQYHDENFYVLDYTNGSIARINRFLSERKMTNLKGFSPNVLLHDFGYDPVTGHFYCFEDNGSTWTLRKYDHLTGQLVFTLPVASLHRCENIKIFGNRLYYIIRDDVNTLSNRIMTIDLY